VFSNDSIIEDSGEPDPQIWDAPQHYVQDLPDDALLFLLASRYCEVDSELKDIAGNLFNQWSPGWTRVHAICNFVNQRLHIFRPVGIGPSCYNSGKLRLCSKISCPFQISELVLKALFFSPRMRAAA